MNTRGWWLIVGVLGIGGIGGAQAAQTAEGAAAPRPRQALTLTRVGVEDVSGATVITLEISGAVSTPLVLREVGQQPPRLYVDLPGVTAGVPSVTTVGIGPVARVRVAVNSVTPLVTRVVVDLTARTAYRLDDATAAGTVRIVLGSAGGATTDVASASAVRPVETRAPAEASAAPAVSSAQPAVPTAPTPAAAAPASAKPLRRSSAQERAEHALAREADTRLPRPLPLVGGADAGDVSPARDRRGRKGAQQELAALFEARTLFAQARYEAAVESAARAQSLAPDDAIVRIVYGRAGLERYRQTAEHDELLRAVQALRSVDGAALGERDQLDLMAGLALGLYMTGEFRAAAGLFEAMLDRAQLVDPLLRDHVLDWWGTSMDRHAQAQPAADRAKTYEVVLTMMGAEMRRDPSSAASGYWLVAATRGLGDLDRAWDAAVAGWVRAQLGRDGGMALRDDLDRLMMSTIIPERAKRMASANQTPADLESLLTTEWRSIKDKWHP